MKPPGSKHWVVFVGMFEGGGGGGCDVFVYEGWLAWSV